MGLAQDFLGLSCDQLMFQAKIDTLVRITTEHSLVGSYDDALEIHRDVDSLKFVKAFCYLKDVEEGDGHHEVYLGTHKDISWTQRLIRRYTKDDLNANGASLNLKRVRVRLYREHHRVPSRHRTSQRRSHHIVNVLQRQSLDPGDLSGRTLRADERRALSLRAAPLGVPRPLRK